MFQGGGQAGVHLAGERQRVVEVFEQDGERRVGVEGGVAGQHFVEDDAERVDVGAGVARAFESLLGGHVVEGAHQRAGNGVLRYADDLGDSEIGENGLPAFGEHDVGRFDVAVDDAFAVGVVEAAQRVFQDAQDFGQRHTLALDAVLVQAGAQGVAFEQFHDHVVDVVLDIEVEDLHNGGMPQPGDGARLAPEAAQEFVLFYQVGTQHFDGHVAVKLRVAGAIDLRHAAAPEGFEDAIFAECLTFQSVCHCELLRDSCAYLTARRVFLPIRPLTAGYWVGMGWILFYRKSRPPEPAPHGADFFGGDEGFRVGIVNQFLDFADILAQYADREHTDHAVFAARRDFGHAKTGLAQGIGKRNPQSRADDLQLGMPNRQSFFDNHANHVPGCKPGGVADDIQRVIQVTQH